MGGGAVASILHGGGVVEDDPLVEVAGLEAIAHQLARNMRNPLDC
jgi:hypothetical protein